MVKVFRLFFIFVIFLCVCGCKPDELNFNIRFNDTEGLVAGDGIYFEGNKVGEVDNVVSTEDGDFLVRAVIQSDYTNAATRSSHFYITNDPQTGGKKSIEIIQEKAGGEVLRDGETVTGSLKPTIFNGLLSRLQKEVYRYQEQFGDDVEKLKDSIRRDSQELGRRLESTLDELSGEFSQFAEDLEQVPDSIELKELEETLDRLIEEMKNAHEDIRDKIRNELIPEIQRRLNLLRENLEQYNRQDEIAPLDRQLKEIQNI